MIGTTISHYKVLEKLGEGGMGVVYKAQDLKLDRLVALKFLPPLASDEKDKQRFIQEAKAASALDHPNICTIYEVDETADGQLFFAMPSYEGETLEQKIVNRPLPVNDCITYAIQIAEGLQAAHKKGIAHRDIKSSNIMVTPEGQVKIMDFGLAKTTGAPMLTKTGATIGTVPYMSPQQARGEKVDHRTDIWSLGVVLYEMICGRLPFESPYSEAVIYSILNEQPKPFSLARSGVPTGVERIVTKCLEKNPTNRYQHADELIADLRQAKEGLANELSPQGSSKRPALRWRKWYLIGGAALVAAILIVVFLPRLTAHNEVIQSIAVLPLENLSRDPEQEYFADGMTEALITNLAKISALRVISRTSVMHFKNTQKTVPEIAKELNVDAVVEGSVQRSGDRVRITAQLLHAPTDRHLWADSYERNLTDVLAMQSEVAQEIARRIQIAVTPSEATRLASGRTVDPEAYDGYLKGMSHLQRRSAKDLEIALQYFQRAVQKDSNYAPAYAGIAQVWGHREVLGLVPLSAQGEGRSAAKKALELDDTSPQAHVVFALIYSVYAAKWLAAENEFRRALELSPNDPDARGYYSTFLVGQGRFREAEDEMKKALQLDPLTAQYHAMYGSLLLKTRRYDDAITELQTAIALNPVSPIPHRELLVAYHLKGMDQQAIAEAKTQFAEIEGDAETAAAVEGGYVRGGFAEAMERAAEVNVTRSHRKYVQPSRIARLYALAGEKDRALEWLQKSFDEQELTAAFLREPVWDFIRSDPRFTALFKKRGLTANETPRSETGAAVDENNANVSAKWQSSIAVLPFKNISSGKEQEYFCDGMGLEIGLRLPDKWRPQVQALLPTERPIPKRIGLFFRHESCDTQ